MASTGFPARPARVCSSSKNGGNITAPSLPALAAQGQRVNGDINVNFANAPRGMRVAGAQTNASGLGLIPMWVTATSRRECRDGLA